MAILPLALQCRAYTATALIPVRMDVIGACSVTASNLDFGNYQSMGDAAARGTATLDLVCPAEMMVEIALDAGTGTPRNTRRRQMSTTDTLERGTLDYDLFKNGDRNQHWGDKDGDTLVLRATGGPQAIEVYGEIPAGQFARTGSYSDVIIVTVNF